MPRIRMGKTKRKKIRINQSQNLRSQPNQNYQKKSKSSGMMGLKHGTRID
jgi:hypothetical protein